MANLPIIRHKGSITRKEAKSKRHSLLIFTDNGTRTSGKSPIDAASWYSRKYGRGRTLYHPRKTLAILRGLDNAYPICTVASFDGKKVTQWNTTDQQRFADVIDQEIDDIRRAMESGKYNEVRIFADHIGQSGAYARIPPALQQHLDARLATLGITPVGKPPERDPNKFLKGLHDLGLRESTMQLGSLADVDPDAKFQALVRLVLTVGIGLPQAATMYEKLKELVGFVQGNDLCDCMQVYLRKHTEAKLVKHQHKNRALYELIAGGTDLIQKLDALPFVDAKRRMEQIHFVGTWTSLSFLLLHHKEARLHASTWVPNDVAVKATVNRLFNIPVQDVDEWSTRSLQNPAQMFFVLQAFDKRVKRSPTKAQGVVNATDRALQIRGLTNTRRVGTGTEYKAVFYADSQKSQWLSEEDVFSWQRERFVQKWAAREQQRKRDGSCKTQ